MKNKLYALSVALVALPFLSYAGELQINLMDIGGHTDTSVTKSSGIVSKDGWSASRKSAGSSTIISTNSPVDTGNKPYVKLPDVTIVANPNKGSDVTTPKTVTISGTVGVLSEITRDGETTCLGPQGGWGQIMINGVPVSLQQITSDNAHKDFKPDYPKAGKCPAMTLECGYRTYGTVENRCFLMNSLQRK